MTIDFLLVLLCCTVFSLVVIIIDYYLCKKNKRKKCTGLILADYARSLLPVFLTVLFIRSFVVQPFRIPSGSLKPTILPGDFILVNQYDYGLRLPVWRNKIISVSKPRRGQIALFFWPVDPHVTFIKRVIGVPGDLISYVNKVFYINGKKMTQRFLDHETVSFNKLKIKIDKHEEDLNGVKHDIYVCRKSEKNCPAQSYNFYRLKVPKGYYFMIGDNRDFSDDSRYWGLVPAKNFIGRAMIIWMSWDSNASWIHKIRWNRIGKHFE